jgi:hypothetical protein
MLTSHKLLYILPDVAYIVELLPTKKEHTFSIQTFRQINGEFIDDNDFIVDNIKKLISKLEDKEYHVILPDFLFTNTIVEVAETDEAKVTAHLKEKLLPELTLSADTHQLKTFILTNHAGKSKVQLSALEKSVLAPVAQSVEEKGIEIKAISPLSWTVKSIISLEPSISIVQMGTHVYLTQHYIGIDQAMSTTVDDVANLAETIKTLKGAEPSIQTVYLITNQLVEEKLKENLSDTLPLQQLASFSEEESEMPSYVKFCIEAGMKTLSLDAFPVPKFPLPKSSEITAPVKDTKTEAEQPATADSSAAAVSNAAVAKKEETTSEVEAPATASSTDESTPSDLPKPAAAPAAATTAATTPAAGAAVTTTVASAVNEITIDTDTTDAAAKVEEPDMPAEQKSSEKTEKSPTTTDSTDKPDTASQPQEQPATTAESSATVESTSPEESVTKEPEVKETEAETEVTAPEISLSTNKDKEDDSDESTDESSEQTSATKDTEETEKEKDKETSTDKKSKDADTEDAKKDDVIKNQSGLQPMLKMLGISFLVFLITVGVGIGVGRAFIYFTQQNTDTAQTTPVASATPTEEEESPTPEASPSPEPTEEIDVTELSVLVVNATTKAGHAGKSATLLEDAEFGEVDAANAKGDYEESGVVVLMEEEDEAILDAIAEALDEEVTFSDEIDVEDAQTEYDAVIVLTE